MLMTLTYASRIAPGHGQQTFDRIVEHALVANRRLGITGVICFANGQIVQILEGERDVVCDLFGRICVDDRNEGVVELGRAWIDTRTFAGWGRSTRPPSDLLTMSSLYTFFTDV